MATFLCETHQVRLVIDGSVRHIYGTRGLIGPCVLARGLPEAELRRLSLEGTGRMAVVMAGGQPILVEERIREVG